MKKTLKIMSLVFVFCFVAFAGIFAQETTEDIERDIRILKIINLFSLDKTQSQQLINIIEENYPRRLRNLQQIRDAMIYYEKEKAPQKYGELKEKDIFISKLQKTNDRIIKSFKDILKPEQKKTAEIIFDIITEDEMKMLMEQGPQILGSITSRIGILWDIGIMPVSPETFTPLIGPLVPIILDLMSTMQAKAREKVLSIIIQPRTVELLKDRIAKMPDDVIAPKEEKAPVIEEKEKPKIQEKEKPKKK